MLAEGGPWGLIILILSLFSLVPTFICVLKKGEQRFFFLSLGISVAAFSFSFLGTGMGIYELGISITEIERGDENANDLLDLFARGIGISMIPIIFGSVFFALNMFLLGVARFLRIEESE